MIQPVGIQMPGSAPAAGFERPFEMLEACHERVQRTLGLLHKLREHLILHGADEQVRDAARDVMRYFDRAAPEHHRDEELHVFPALLALCDAPTQALVARLRQDHLEMESGWTTARAVLAAIAEGTLARLTPADDAHLDAFAALYDRHIEDEETIAYPAARARLTGEPLREMTRDMMARRGIAPR
jgi:hemerythrin-like domain-containing protein